MKPATTTEICRTIRAALHSWAATLRLCVILAVLSIGLVITLG